MQTKSASKALGGAPLGRMPYSLPVIQCGKGLKKKCCKKYKKGKRCGRCPNR